MLRKTETFSCVSIQNCILMTSFSFSFISLIVGSILFHFVLSFRSLPLDLSLCSWNFIRNLRNNFDTLSSKCVFLKNVTFCLKQPNCDSITVDWRLSSAVEIVGSLLLYVLVLFAIGFSKFRNTCSFRSSSL